VGGGNGCFVVGSLFRLFYFDFTGRIFRLHLHTHQRQKTLLRIILFLFLPIFCLRFVIVMIQLVVTLGNGHGKWEKYFVGMFRPGHSKNRA
jgi:hypothetical protein